MTNIKRERNPCDSMAQPKAKDPTGALVHTEHWLTQSHDHRLKGRANEQRAGSPVVAKAEIWNDPRALSFKPGT